MVEVAERRYWVVRAGKGIMETAPTIGDESAMDDVELLTTREFLERTGGRISRNTLYRYLDSGLIPKSQPYGRKGKILIPADALTRVIPERAGPERGTTVRRDHRGDVDA